MESVLAIGVGLGLRVVIDAATDDHRLGGVLIGLWEGVVLNHFLRRMPRSYDPYIALGFRVFVDFLFTQSLSRMALVALWTVVGMLLADIAPNVWRDSGLRRLYRRLRREFRHIRRAVPDIRIKNDIPTVRLFSSTRAPSTVVSIRSDRATPAQSPAPGTTAIPGPPRRPGRKPPGAFPSSSGWSETETEVTTLRGRVVMSPGPSPALIPTRIDVQLQHSDTSNDSIPQAQSQPLPTTELHDTTILFEMDHPIPSATSAPRPIDDPTNQDPPTIPDDWVDVSPPLRPQADAPTVPPLSGLQEPVAGSSSVPPRPESVVEPTPRISLIPDIPEMHPTASDAHPPYQIPLPGSRAATVIGGAEEQPSGVWRSAVVARMEKACSELGVDPLHPVAPYPTILTSDSSKLQHLSEERSDDVVSKARSEKATSAIGDPDDVPGVEPQTSTPTQVDPPADTSVVNTPVDNPPLPPAKSWEPNPSTAGPAATDGGNPNTSPVPDRDIPATEPRRDTAYLDPDPTHDPPPSFSEAVGEVDGAQRNSDPVTQDEQSTELSDEQKAMEGRRQEFLMKELARQQAERDRLQAELDGKPKAARAATLKSKLEDILNSLEGVKMRMSKKQFSGENVLFAMDPVLSSI
ncbi:hypothetical protein V8B97DRAFT_1938029 [Scleroderma yunnanense]